ncbi:MAG: magnesium transporter CorA [Bacteroidetes bacterium]|nr:magnesium transporter CorA [Bacteroidota bacterium]
MQAIVREQNFKTFSWINITNPSEADLMTLSADYSLDHALVADSMQHGHLPKIEVTEDYTFIILRGHTAAKNDEATTVGGLSNKIAFFIRKNQLITVHRAEFDFLLNKEKAYKYVDQLLLEIIADLVNSYTEPLRMQSEKMDEIEQIIFLKSQSKISVKDLYYQRTKARVCKKILQMMQSVLNQLHISASQKMLLEDTRDTLTDTMLQYDEIVENAQNLLNTYLSITSQKNNDVMRLLTIFSVFFLPLTFLAGIYGMNFDNMPELKTTYGYFVVLFVMVIISLLIYVWFKWKKIL